MKHSPYVATTLKTWEEKGAKKLQRLFARMGVPLAACRQKYTHMSANLVAQLEAKLEEFGREVRLLNMHRGRWRQLRVWQKGGAVKGHVSPATGVHSACVVHVFSAFGRTCCC